MTFLGAKSVNALYDEVVAHDLVVVPDAPLAGAINRRLDRPRLGPFAVTPRRLAAGRRERAEDRLAFLETVDRIDRDWAQVAYEVGNILQCWEHQGRLDAIFAYETYVTDATREAVDAVDSLDTTSGRLEAFRIGADRDVAVVGEAQLTPLERSILPDDYTAVDPFRDAASDRPPFHVFGSKTAVVETVVDAVDADAADDVAVVLDRNSAYSPLVESALEAASIPFYGGPGFADDPDHRAFLTLCRTVRAGSDTRVRDVRPLLARLGDAPARAHDEKRLAALDDHGDALGWVRAVRAGVDDHTFGTLLAAFGDRIGRDLAAFRTELERLGITDAPVTSARTDRLAFYLQTYEVPVDRQNEGVLLADATSAAYVGRPTVFHLGLDDGWTPAPPNRPWVDREGQYTRNVRDFQLLLQSGRQQYYLVTDAAGGSPVTPALYLQDLLEESVERFTDLDHVAHTTRGRTGGDGFDRVPVDGVDAEAVESISQSSLARYVNSPRDYFFSRLVEAPDRDYLTEGNLLHDFAEFCVAHPDFVDDDVVSDAVEFVLDEVGPLLRGVDEPACRTEYRVACETIRAYVAAHDTRGDPALSEGTARRDENAFARRYDRPVDTPHTERWFDDTALGLKGKIDLVATPTELVDHKSGTKGSARSVVRQSALDPPNDRPDFQALAYLTYWRSRRPDTAHEFTFFHFLETLDDAVAGDADLAETLTTVTYRPTTFVDHVRSRATFDHLAGDDAANDCQKTFAQAAYDDWQAAFGVATPPASGDSAELLDSAFADALIDRMRAVVGEYTYVTSGCEQALRELARIYGRTYFAGDLDAFESFVDERLAELTARRAGAERFPVAGLAGDPNERRLDHPDLLLEGSR